MSADASLDGTVRYRKSRTAQVVSSEGKTLFFDALELEAETGVGRYVGTGATTLSADAAALAASITVADVAGISDGYGIDVTLDDGSLFSARVAGIVGSVVTLSTAITGAATTGNAVGFYDYDARFPTIDLDFSDDGGKTWGDKLSAELGGPGDYTNRIGWDQLGGASKRIFRLETDAPAKVIISDGYLTVRVGVS